jgi:hypothetical protein
VLDGVPDQLDPVVQLQLAQRVLHVVLHGAVGQHQPGRDLLVGQAGGDHAEDFRLALGQPGHAVAGHGGPGRQPPELAQHERGQAGGEHRVAAGGTAHRVEELRARGRLQQVADRTRLHRVQHVLLLAAGREYQDADRGVGGVQAPGHLDPGHVRQPQVEHDHVGPGGPRDPQRLRAVGGGGDDVVPGLGEVPCDRVPPHRVIVDDHHPDWTVLTHVRLLDRSR